MKCSNVLTDNDLPLVSPTSSRPPLVNVPPDSVSDQTPLKGPAKWDKLMRKFAARRLARLDKHTTALVDSGATSIFLTEDAPKVNIVNNAEPIRVGAAAGPPSTSTTTCELALSSELPSDFPIKGHVMRGFHETLLV